MKKCLSGEIKNKSIKKYVEKYAYFWERKNRLFFTLITENVLLQFPQKRKSLLLQIFLEAVYEKMYHKIYREYMSHGIFHSMTITCVTWFNKLRQDPSSAAIYYSSIEPACMSLNHLRWFTFVSLWWIKFLWTNYKYLWK